VFEICRYRCILPHSTQPSVWFPSYLCRKEQYRWESCLLACWCTTFEMSCIFFEDAEGDAVVGLILRETANETWMKLAQNSVRYPVSSINGAETSIWFLFNLLLAKQACFHGIVHFLFLKSHNCLKERVIEFCEKVWFSIHLLRMSFWCGRNITVNIYVRTQNTSGVQQRINRKFRMFISEKSFLNTVIKLYCSWSADRNCMKIPLPVFRCI
jgi:hypothetical protein